MRMIIRLGILGSSLAALGAAYFLLWPTAAEQEAAGADRTAEDWAERERGILDHHVQLTFPDRFVKAGESYFSPDESKIIFQGIEVARGEEPAETYYQMYVADLVRNDAGRITGIDNIKRLSPPGSSNTCGWFHPTKPDTVIFASTIVEPKDEDQPGFQRGVSQYVWHFPPEMTIVECNLADADGTAATLTPLITDPDAYLAECVISPDGRYLAYCKRHKDDQLGGDLIVRDLATGREVPIISAPGYDGGPFFSPDGKRLCYRSDRRGNNLLQIFVAELAFDEVGALLGIDREFQLTDNEFVNWAPFWHPEGRHLIYTTSAHGHTNYEIYIVDADPGGTRSERSPAKYGTKMRRITFSEKFDGLPVFNGDGSLLMWTSQRDPSRTSQLWLAEFVLPIDEEISVAESGAPPGARRAEFVHVTDPENGTIYVYDARTHVVSIYDPKTHEMQEVKDEAHLKRALELFRQRESDG